MNYPIITKIIETNKENNYIKTIKFKHDKKIIPGQFYMIWIPGVDEIPMSVSYINHNTKGITFKKIGDAPFSIIPVIKDEHNYEKNSLNVESYSSRTGGLNTFFLAGNSLSLWKIREIDLGRIVYPNQRFQKVKREKLIDLLSPHIDNFRGELRGLQREYRTYFKSRKFFKNDIFTMF